MKNKMQKVLIAAPVHSILIDGLKALGYQCLIHEDIKQESAFELIKDCEGVITSTRIQLNKELILAAPHLKWIGRMGSGLEVIDTDFATERGILYYSSPEGNCNAVGEHALGMLLSLIHKITWSHNELKNGIWEREKNRGIELEGRTIGIIGFGHTGKAFAKKLIGFDARILAYDKKEMENVPPNVIACTRLDAIFEEAEIVSFHVPLQKDTLYYFNSEFVSKMKHPFILLNTSRGKVVDLVAVYNGIEQGKITGACLDVFEEEPIKLLDNERKALLEKMISYSNVIATSHIAGYTHEALYKMSKILLNKIEDSKE